MNPLEKLAGFVHRLRFEDVDKAAATQVTLCLADSLGCLVYGSRAEHVRKALAAYKPMQMPDGSHIFFESWKAPAPLASFLNGSMIGANAYDDLHHGATVHCGCIVIPAALAALDGCGRTVSGKEFLTTLVAGYETMIRVALAVMPEVRHRGYHPASVVAPFAAAAAASRIYGLTEEETLNAIGIAGDFGSGLMSAQLSSNIHGMQAPYASMHGVNGALMARHGLLGIREIFDDTYGSFLTTLSGKYDPAPIEAIGDGEFLCKGTGIKFYPTAGSVSSAVDGVRDLMEQNGIRPEEVEKITVRVNKSVFLHCGFDYEPGPISGAQMHIGYCIAALLVSGQLGARQFEPAFIKDPRVPAAMKKVEVIHDPAMDDLGPGMGYCARISLVAAGKTYACEIVNPRGSAGNPLSEAGVREKFMTQCAGILPEDKAGRLFSAVMGIADLADVRDLEAMIS